MTKNKVKTLIDKCVGLVDSARLSEEEVVVFLVHLLIRSGYSIHWGAEVPKKNKPKTITKEDADKLYYNSPSTGTVLMKAGFDLQSMLVPEKEKTI
jgi:hypothetical protein